MKNKIIASILIIAGFFGFVKIVKDYAGRQSCVHIYVDYGVLKQNKVVSECVPVDGRMNALTILKHGGFNLEGTQKYGLQVVCRVDGLPSKEQESCLKMPPENAYWALLVKKQLSVLDTNAKWGWAQDGVAKLILTKGDSVGLVFVKNGKFKWPN